VAYIDYVINASGDLVERRFVDDGSGGYLQLPDNYAGADPVVTTSVANESPSYEALSEPQTFVLPAEVLELLSPGTDPFASLAPPNTSAGAPAGSPSTSAPAPNFGVPIAGAGGLLPAIGGLVPLDTLLSPLNAVINAELFPDWGVGPLGQVFFEEIRNRQATGVRFGTLPMVVWPSGRR